MVDGGGGFSGQPLVDWHAPLPMLCWHLQVPGLPCGHEPVHRASLTVCLHCDLAGVGVRDLKLSLSFGNLCTRLDSPSCMCLLCLCTRRPCDRYLQAAVQARPEKMANLYIEEGPGCASAAAIDPTQGARLSQVCGLWVALAICLGLRRPAVAAPPQAEGRAGPGGAGSQVVTRWGGGGS
jgi:hypothetical protein